MWERLRHVLLQYGWLIGSVALLFAVYVLPPDTSLAEVKRNGVLTACVPTTRPPLVTGDPTAPGLEIELLAAIADEMGLRFLTVTVPAMGQDFDPSLWRITRAQCALVGGGTLDTIETRAFLDVTPSFGETGWIVLTRDPDMPLQGKTAAVLANVPGADRIGLSRYLREQGMTVRLVRSLDELSASLTDGTADIGIADALYARPLAAGIGFATMQLPPPLALHKLVFGLWKGDLTLKRAIVGAFSRIEGDGRLDALKAKYLAD